MFLVSNLENSFNSEKEDASMEVLVNNLMHNIHNFVEILIIFSIKNLKESKIMH